jgi:hypothetical protein
MSNATHEHSRMKSFWTMAEYDSLPVHLRPPHAVQVDGIGWLDPSVILGPAIKAAVSSAIGTAKEGGRP